MPPRKDSSVFSLDELPNLNYDINSKQALELEAIKDKDIQNSQTLCEICADGPEKEINNRFLGFCTFIVKMETNLERNKFLSDSRKSQFLAAISVYRSLISKIDTEGLNNSEIRETIEKIYDLFKKCLNVLYDTAYFNIIDYCEKNITKKLKKIHRFIEDQELDDSELTEAISSFKKSKKSFYAILEVAKKDLNLIQCNSAISALKHQKEILDQIVTILTERHSCVIKENPSNWVHQEIISTLDIKAMIIGNTLYKMMKENLALDVVEEPVRRRGRPPKNSKILKQKEEIVEEDEDEDQKDDEKSEEDEDDYTKDEDEDLQIVDESTDRESQDATTYDKEMSDDSNSKQTNRQKRMDKLENLINPILQLDCKSESPILAAFWISKLRDMKHAGREIISQTFISVFAEMRHFLDNFDMTYPAAKFFSYMVDLYFCNADLQTKLKLGKLTEFEPLIKEFDSFYILCRMINTSPKRISSMFKVLECSRKIMEIIESNEITDKTLIDACNIFRHMRSILVPIMQVNRAIEGLNEYAEEQNLPIEKLEVKFNNFISLDAAPYNTFSQHTLSIGKHYEQYILELAKKIEESGINILAKKTDGSPYSVEHLIIPSLTNIFTETAQAIEKCIPKESNLYQYSESIQTQLIDGRNLIEIIKEFIELCVETEINKEPTADIEHIIKLLKDIFRVHSLFISLEMGELITYSNALHFTYLRVFSRFISLDNIFENQSILAPVSCQLLVDVQKITNDKIHLNILEQKVSLLNRMKIAFSDLFAVAFTKEDGEEYDNISQWINIVTQLCQMTEVDGVQQIKPLCINLPKLPEFPKLAEDLWQLVEKPLLNEKEKNAIQHIEGIYAAEFNGEDVTTSIDDIGKLSIVAQTRDYTELLRRVMDYGFASVDDGYELGQYGDSYANRFIEHHWRINLCQIDDFLDKIYDSLPKLTPQTKELYDTFSLIKHGGLTLVNVIKLGTIALRLRSLFCAETEFTTLYKMLHTLILYLEHHDILAELIAQIADSGLIAFSFLRSFNYLRFIKYITGLALRLNSSSVFNDSDSAAIFTQCITLRTYATTIKPTMKLTDESCDKLNRFINCLRNVFEEGNIKFDALFAKAKLCLGTLTSKYSSNDIVSSLIRLLNEYQEATKDLNSTEMHNVSKKIKKEIYESKNGRDNCFDEFISIIDTIFSIAQLHACLEPASSFIENSGINYFKFKNKFELCDFRTFSHTGSPRFQPFVIPRPKLTVPSTTLSKDQQEQVLSLFEQLQDERKESLKKMDEYNKTKKEERDEHERSKEIYKARQKIFESINETREKLNKLPRELEEEPVQEFSTKSLEEVELKGKLTNEYSNMFSIANVFSTQINEMNDMLKKRSDSLAGMMEEASPMFDASLQRSNKESNDDIDGKSDQSASKYLINPDGVDKQLIPILELCGYKTKSKENEE